jgi:hypothetical protein
MTSQALFTRAGAVACLLVLPALAIAQLPSGLKTPGAASKVTAKQVCAPDYQASKPVAKWQRDEALERYGIRPETFTGDLDHLIPVSLGGSNDPDNLWPQHSAADLTPAAKDQLGAKLHELVCGNTLTLKAAQDAIRKDWVKAYKQYVQTGNAASGK